MSWLVSAFGVLLFAIGVCGVFAPEAVIGAVRRWSPGRRMGIAVGVRAGMGVIFLLAAGSCRHPRGIAALGAIALLAAVVLPFIGSERLDRMIEWGFSSSPSWLRAWFVAALLFAGFLVWTGLPAAG